MLFFKATGGKSLFLLIFLSAHTPILHNSASVAVAEFTNLTMAVDMLCVISVPCSLYFCNYTDVVTRSPKC